MGGDLARPGASWDEADAAEDWHHQFERWREEAVAAGEPEVEAVSLATVGGDARPSVRFVLCKAVDPGGFVFYTNRRSRKGGELAARPRAALAWRWARLDRQVRAVGAATAVDDEQSDRYFATRPRGAQLGAWASAQSQVIAGRGVLEERLAELAERFAGGDVPRPPWWGGWRVVPEEVEFWQGRPDRLHDRLRYRRAGGAWLRERLAP